MRTNYPLSMFGRSRLFGATRGAVAAAALTFFVGLGTALAAPAFNQIDEDAIPALGDRWAAPTAYVTMQVDLDALRVQLAGAPLARSNDALPAPIVELPMPDGSFQGFRVFDSPIMAPALAEEYPELKTYEAYGEDDASAFARFSVTPVGFHAVIFRSGGSVWIDPYQSNDIEHVSITLGSDYRRADGLGLPACGFEATPQQVEEVDDLVRRWEARGGDSTGDELRTYRIAIAATGEYTVFHGGTVNAGMAAIVVALNRINGIYQIEVSVLMELVPNNNLVVYTNGATDPYNNSNGSQMLGQNQSNLDAVIGNANYDIGHVFSTGGGGVANLGCVCVNTRKAQGVTGLPGPIGDNFYVDFVAHEMGHQYSGLHTFNGTAGNCAGGNRSATAAYEPGSGTTIMAYAGICSPQNIQQHSDDYFHVHSFVQIRAFTETGTGNSCPVTTPTGNTPPVADASQGVSYTIPISTYFSLTGAGSDADGDDLTYCWEEYDLGPAGSPTAPVGNAPLFRSYLPKTTSTRIFPKIEQVASGVPLIGEILPSYARNLRFRLTVRDGLGGVNYDEAELIAVAANGPFTVTYPNALGITWNGGTNETVTWDVAGTNAGPINCQNVNILLSADGGFTYPHLILANTPNDGSQTITVPNVPTTTGRIMVEAADNIFFDISNRNFTIDANPTDAPVAEVRTDGILLGNDPNPFSNVTHVRFRLEDATPVQLRVYDPTGRVVAILADGTLEAGLHTASWNGADMDGQRVPAGVYFYRLQAGDRVESKQLVIMD